MEGDGEAGINVAATGVAVSRKGVKVASGVAIGDPQEYKDRDATMSAGR